MKIRLSKTSRQSISYFPKFVSIETHNLCNAKCIFCPHPRLRGNDKILKLSEDLFQKVIDECARYDDLKKLTLSFQNEPLMDRRIFEQIGYARERIGRQTKIALVTNASLLSSNRIKELVKNPPDILKIGVHTIDKEAYERTMVGLVFEKVISNIEELITLTAKMKRPAIQINSVFTKDFDDATYKRTKKFWEKRGVKFHITNLENRAGFMKDIINLSENKWRVRMWCQRPNKQLSITVTGDVVLCCAIWNREIVLGNVKNKSLFEIWHDKYIQYYRDILANGYASELFPCCNCMQADIVLEGKGYIQYNEGLIEDE